MKKAFTAIVCLILLCIPVMYAMASTPLHGELSPISTYADPSSKIAITSPVKSEGTTWSASFTITPAARIKARVYSGNDYASLAYTYTTSNSQTKEPRKYYPGYGNGEATVVLYAWLDETISGTVTLNGTFYP